MSARSTSGTAIVGIGATEFSRESGRSELRLAVEAISSALADAGLSFDDVDGLCTFDMDTNDPATVAPALGLNGVTHFWQSSYGGGGGCSTVLSAAMAVTTGAADVVVAYRAMNERSGRRYGQVSGGKRRVPLALSHYTPYGIHTAAQCFALNISRYMHTYDVTNADFAPVAVAARRHASTNPAAFFYGKPITIDDHQASRWIVEPGLRLLDCCLESDGAVAIVITSAERARDLRQRPVQITAGSQGLVGPQMRDYYRSSIISADETAVAARKLWATSGLRPQDMSMAILYDHFTPLVLMQIEALGFCGPGEGKDFVADGRIDLDGALPINTNGGQLGEAYIHGMNGIAEAVRQLRGSAVNQVDDVEHVLVTSGPGVPTSALILSPT
ncbi:MAG: lipid-transfer protein [Acidimicrobiia bacterium]